MSIPYSYDVLGPFQPDYLDSYALKPTRWGSYIKKVGPTGHQFPLPRYNNIDGKRHDCKIRPRAFISAWDVSFLAWYLRKV